jgi:cellulose synthase/poly-beta-1,6-N-acetylglucosamine synthase-like glycosyltransferase
MFGYLGFIFLRTAFHLAFSFAGIAFLKRVRTPRAYPLITIIVPCFNEEDVLAAAVDSVLHLEYPNFEVIVVDDGSSDSTLAVAEKLKVRARVRIVHQKNAGKAAALNTGIEAAHGEYVLCMDADSKLNPDVLQLGIVHFERDPLLAAVAGTVRLGNVRNTLVAFQNLEYITGLNLFKEAQSFLKSVMIIPGPIGLFRKEAVLEVGGYHSDTFAEDADLSVRLLTKGYHAVYEPRMVAVTEGPEDFFSLIAQRYRWNRGILQAIRVNSKWFLTPFSNFRNFFVITYMAVESIFIPLANFVFAIVTLQYALINENVILLGAFFFQLTFMDVLLALYCVIMEQNTVKLVFLSVFNRLTYGFSLDVLRFLSIFDEMLALPMNWGKLKRRGLGSA